MMKFLVTVIAFCSIQIVTSRVCSWNTGCPNEHLSNKTPYNLVRGDIRDSLVTLAGCEPVSIWSLIRHGQRNPGAVYGKLMKEALIIKDHVVSSYENGNSSLCAQDVENLSKWIDDERMFDRPSELTKEGYLESEGIGRRLKQAFPTLLSKLEGNDYVFRPARGSWIAESAKGFVQGLDIKLLTIQPAKTDFDVVVPYDTCSKYIGEVKNNPKTYSESDKYHHSSEYLATKDRIQQRLGIDYSLSDTNISALYDLCRYTSSGISNQCSPWCALFTTEDLKVMEYIADLRLYYRGGYGSPMNELFGQLTLADLLKSFQEAKTGKGRKITSYFTHVTMLDMTYTALKLFQDDAPLTAAKRDNNRKWKTSNLAVFSSNLMVVLNKCNQGGEDNYKAVFYFNEELLKSICMEGVCTWREFEDKLSPFKETNTDFCVYDVPPTSIPS